MQNPEQEQMNSEEASRSPRSQLQRTARVDRNNAQQQMHEGSKEHSDSLVSSNQQNRTLLQRLEPKTYALYAQDQSSIWK